MDPNLIYAKTPIGDEAVRQSTRVVQRNLRMVLVQVDGKVSVEELSTKIGNPRLVESALKKLEEGGYIVPSIEAISVWEESKRLFRDEAVSVEPSAISAFSAFGPVTGGQSTAIHRNMADGHISSFSKPVFPDEHRGKFFAENPISSEQIEQSGKEKGFDERTAWRQRPMPRVFLLAVCLFGILTGALVLFYPYERHKRAVEIVLEQFLGAPVMVGGLNINMWPSPHLKLNEVKIGEGSRSSVDEMRIFASWSLLFSETIEISRVDIVGASLTVPRLVAIPVFQGRAVSIGNLRLSQVRMENMQLLMSDGLSLGDFFGELRFGHGGLIEKAAFETIDRGLLIDAQASPNGIELDIQGRSWKLPDSGLVLTALQARGLLQGDKLSLRDIDTTFLGGVLRGDGELTWQNGVAMTGSAKLLRLDARQVAAVLVPLLGLEGVLNASLRLQSTGNSWSDLVNRVDAVLSAEIFNGIFYGVDLGEAVRRNGQSEVRAGSTKFDRLRAVVTISPQQVIARDVRMEAGVLRANGQFVAGRDGMVESSMAVHLRGSVSSIQVPVRIYGRLPDLNAIVRK